MYDLDEREVEAVRQVFARRKLFRYQAGGAGECDLFEAEFSKIFGVAHSLLLTSGTNALVAALGACEIGPGDEVIIPAYTFVATAMAVVQVGAIPVIANIDETLGISPSEVEALVTDRTRAIIPVHMDGLAADIGAIVEIAKRRKLRVIEDVAQALGASFRGRRLGSWGDFGCFSLNENKHLSAGEGGIAVTSQESLYERAFCIHDGSAQFNPNKKDSFRQISPFLGGSMRVSEITGAIMRIQLQRLEGILSSLRQRKNILLAKLAHQTLARLPVGACPNGDSGSSLHLFLPDPATALKVSRALWEIGIAFAPVISRPAHVCWKWASFLGDRSSWNPRNNAYRLTDRVYTYPTSKYLSSVAILTCMLRLEIDPNLSLDETERLSDRILSVLTRI